MSAETHSNLIAFNQDDFQNLVKESLNSISSSKNCSMENKEQQKIDIFFDRTCTWMNSKKELIQVSGLREFAAKIKLGKVKEIIKFNIENWLNFFLNCFFNGVGPNARQSKISILNVIKELSMISKPSSMNSFFRTFIESNLVHSETSMNSDLASWEILFDFEYTRPYMKQYQHVLIKKLLNILEKEKLSSWRNPTIVLQTLQALSHFLVMNSDETGCKEEQLELCQYYFENLLKEENIPKEICSKASLNILYILRNNVDSTDSSIIAEYLENKVLTDTTTLSLCGQLSLLTTAIEVIAQDEWLEIMSERVIQWNSRIFNIVMSCCVSINSIPLDAKLVGFRALSGFIKYLEHTTDSFLDLQKIEEILTSVVQSWEDPIDSLQYRLKDVISALLNSSHAQEYLKTLYQTVFKLDWKKKSKFHILISILQENKICLDEKDYLNLIENALSIVQVPSKFQRNAVNLFVQVMISLDREKLLSGQIEIRLIDMLQVGIEHLFEKYSDIDHYPIMETLFKFINEKHEAIFYMMAKYFRHQAQFHGLFFQHIYLILMRIKKTISEEDSCLLISYMQRQDFPLATIAFEVICNHYQSGFSRKNRHIKSKLESERSSFMADNPMTGAVFSYLKGVFRCPEACFEGTWIKVFKKYLDHVSKRLASEWHQKFMSLAIMTVFPGQYFIITTAALDFMKLYLTHPNIEIDLIYHAQFSRAVLPVLMNDSYDKNRIKAFDILNKFSRFELSLEELENLLDQLNLMIDNHRPTVSDCASMFGTFLFLESLRYPQETLKLGNYEFKCSAEDILKTLTRALSEKVDDMERDASSLCMKPFHGLLLLAKEFFTSCISGKLITVEQSNSIVDDIMPPLEKIRRETFNVVSNHSPEGYIPESLTNSEIPDVFTESVQRRLLTHSYNYIRDVMSLMSLNFEIIIAKSSESAITIYKNMKLWLLECRHAGAVSHIYQAFSKMSKSLVCRGHIQALETILSEFLIEMTVTEISYTRRSAGIPYLVLAILLYTSKADRTRYLQKLMQGMSAIMQLEDGSVCQIHAFNILRVIVRDAQISQEVEPHLEQIFLFSLEFFKSRSYPVRNAAAMTFSCLFSRIFGSQLGHRQDGRQRFFTSREFEKQFPRVWRNIVENLPGSSLIDENPVEQGLIHAIFQILAQLHPPSREFSGTEHTKDLSTIFNELCRLAGHKVFLTRRMASRSFNALFGQDQDKLKNVAKMAMDIWREMDEGKFISKNELHGLMMYLRNVKEKSMVMDDEESFWEHYFALVSEKSRCGGMHDIILQDLYCNHVAEKSNVDDMISNIELSQEASVLLKNLEIIKTILVNFGDSKVQPTHLDFIQNYLENIITCFETNDHLLSALDCLAKVMNRKVSDGCDFVLGSPKVLERIFDLDLKDLSPHHKKCILKFGPLVVTKNQIDTLLHWIQEQSSDHTDVIVKESSLNALINLKLDKLTAKQLAKFFIIISVMLTDDEDTIRKLSKEFILTKVPSSVKQNWLREFLCCLIYQNEHVLLELYKILEDRLITELKCVDDILEEIGQMEKAIFLPEPMNLYRHVFHHWNWMLSIISVSSLKMEMHYEISTLLQKKLSTCTKELMQRLPYLISSRKLNVPVMFDHAIIMMILNSFNTSFKQEEDCLSMLEEDGNNLKFYPLIEKLLENRNNLEFLENF